MTKSKITLPVSDFVKAKLESKGIRTNEDAEKFLFPDIKNLHPARDVDNILDAVQLFEEHLAKKSFIIFITDYDVDGIGSTAVLYEGLKDLMNKNKCRYSFKLPNRIEGYGLNIDVLKKLMKFNPGLLVTADNGIKSVEEIAYLRENGVDVIVLDHHAPDESNLPKPNVLVDLHLSDSTYPFKELCGAAVCYKFVEALYEKRGLDFHIQNRLLQYVALSTIADVVSLTGENRLLVQLGLQQINANPNLGIKALLKAMNVEGEVTTEDINYNIGPALNAPGRILVPDTAFALFKTTDEAIAKTISEDLVKINAERKLKTETFVNLGFKEIEKFSGDNVYVLTLNDCPEGIVGLVAGQIKEQTGRPAIVLAYHDGYYTGSARSIPAFNMAEELISVGDLMIRYGGHAMAAGLSIKEENIPLLRKALNKRANEILSEEDYKQDFDVEDVELINSDIEDYHNQLKWLEPFGQDNPKPIFRVNFMTKSPPWKEDGEVYDLMKEKHLKIYGDNFLSAVGFSMKDKVPLVEGKDIIPILGQLSVNTYKGRTNHQVMILDIEG